MCPRSHKEQGQRATASPTQADHAHPVQSPQHISNQLHGTIAVVRPGAWACSADRGSTNGTPSAQSSPPSPPYEHSLSLDR